MNLEKYTAFFCEENIWHLLESMNSTQQKNSSILFITNEYKSCALMNQRAAKKSEYIVWDYHFILHNHLENQIYDYDSIIDMNTNIVKYFDSTFGQQSLLPTQYRSLILSIPGSEYLTKFSSDRSHMLDVHGNQVQRFPDWPPIKNQGGFTLKDLLSLNKETVAQFKIYSTEEYLKKFV